MKKTFLLFGLWLAFCTTIKAQNRNSSISERTETSDVIVEGRIVAQNSFWDNDHNSIYTENQIEVFKSFKGTDRDTISIVSRGGIVNDQFQIVSHAIEFQLSEEGLFFCKNFSVPNLSTSETLMLNDINGFVKYRYGRERFQATDRFTTYNNLKTEIYQQITQQTTSEYIVKKKNSLEKNIEAWLEETLTVVSNTDILIEFTFDNINLIGTDEVEFDIMAKSNQENIKFAASDVYISYSTDAFGNSVVVNDKIEATKETVIENDVYTLELTDEAADVVKFLVNAGLEPDQLYPLAQIAEKFLHIRLDIENVYELASLSFEDFLMANQSFFYDEETGEFVGFDKIAVENPIFPFLMPGISSFSPNPITAGTSSELTIIGTNFGDTKGKVRFPNADDGGLSFMEADDADVTWSDTEIIVKVPSVRAGVGQQGNPAGSGIFQIQTAPSPTFPNGEIAQNNPPLLPLDIRYAVANFRSTPAGVRPHMAELNGMDGYTLHLGVSLANEPNATSIVEQSLCDWNMVTGVNWILDATPIQVPVANGEDEINTIFLGGEGNFVGSTAGATAFTTITGMVCQNGTPDPPTYIKDVDIVLRADPSNISPLLGWHFDENTNPNLFDFDFYSVIKHELGHAHNLKHAIPDNKLMYWQLLAGNTQRDFNPEDINGGNDVLDAAVALNQGFCAFDPMTRSNTLCLNSVHDAGVQKENFLIFPNPVFGNSLNVNILNNSSPIKKFELWNTIGEKNLDFSIEQGSNNNNTYQLNIPSRISSGVYLLHALDEYGNIIFSGKVIKL
jgi:hypothetical protein